METGITGIALRTTLFTVAGAVVSPLGIGGSALAGYIYGVSHYHMERVRPPATWTQSVMNLALATLAILGSVYLAAHIRGTSINLTQAATLLLVAQGFDLFTSRIIQKVSPLLYPNERNRYTGLIS